MGTFAAVVGFDRDRVFIVGLVADVERGLTGAGWVASFRRLIGNWRARGWRTSRRCSWRAVESQGSLHIVAR